MAHIVMCATDEEVEPGKIPYGPGGQPGVVKKKDIEEDIGHNCFEAMTIQSRHMSTTLAAINIQPIIV